MAIRTYEEMSMTRLKSLVVALILTVISDPT